MVKTTVSNCFKKWVKFKFGPHLLLEKQILTGSDPT